MRDITRTCDKRTADAAGRRGGARPSWRIVRRFTTGMAILEPVAAALLKATSKDAHRWPCWFRMTTLNIYVAWGRCPGMDEAGRAGWLILEEIGRRVGRERRKMTACKPG